MVVLTGFTQPRKQRKALDGVPGPLFGAFCPLWSRSDSSLRARSTAIRAANVPLHESAEFRNRGGDVALGGRSHLPVELAGGLVLAAPRLRVGHRQEIFGDVLGSRGQILGQRA